MEISQSSSSSSSSSSSFVSKARTAFHSAAAKAERVFSDLRDSDKQSSKNLTKLSEDESTSTEGESKFKWRPAPIGTKQDWQARLRSIGIGKDNSSMLASSYEENSYMINTKNDIEAKVRIVGKFGLEIKFGIGCFSERLEKSPGHSKAVEAIPSVEGLSAANNGLIPPYSAIKQLAIAAEAGKKYKSMKDFLASSGGSSPGREKGLSLSAVKSLVLRDKDNKLISEFGNNEKVLALIRTLFDADTHFPKWMISSGSEAATIISFAREIHGSPPESLIVKVAEVIGSFKNLKKAALFWCRVVAELKRLWSVEEFIPGIPPDSIPDLNSCLLYQQLQVINCCISRKRRRDIASQSLDIVLKDSSLNAEESATVNVEIVANSVLYAKTNSGELIVRLGADRPFSDLTMLKTGERVYSPVTQEGPLLTEDLIKENEEFVLRTGSVGAGCSQLLSDMQAFKAANPGSILEDFVRWHSPPDWTEAEQIHDDNKNPFDDGDLFSTRGQLSSRMQKEGNLWREFWDTSKPVPAVRQAPLFDEDLAVEGILETLEEIPPSELFQQLFISLLGSGFAAVEASLPSNTDLTKLFYECKDYALTTCQSGIWCEKIDDLCEVYETVERIWRNPEEVLKSVKQADESGNNAGGETRKLFKRLNLNFGAKDRPSRKTPPTKVQKSPDKNNHDGQPFSSFFEGKSSLFSKISPSPKPASTPPVVKSTLLENDWTMV